jgi:hypothetical protein
VKPSPSREATSRAVTQQVNGVLYNPQVHYRILKSSPFVSMLSLINPVHITLSYPSSVLILSTHLSIRHPSSLFHSGFPINNLYAFLFPIRSTSPAHLILLYMRSLIALGGAPHHAGFSDILSFHLPSVQISSASCSRAPQVCVHSLMLKLCAARKFSKVSITGLQLCLY